MIKHMYLNILIAFRLTEHGHRFKSGKHLGCALYTFSFSFHVLYIFHSYVFTTNREYDSNNTVLFAFLIFLSKECF